MQCFFNVKWLSFPGLFLPLLRGFVSVTVPLGKQCQFSVIHVLILSVTVASAPMATGMIVIFILESLSNLKFNVPRLQFSLSFYQGLTLPFLFYLPPIFPVCCLPVSYMCVLKYPTQSYMLFWLKYILRFIVASFLFELKILLRTQLPMILATWSCLHLLDSFSVKPWHSFTIWATVSFILTLFIYLIIYFNIRYGSKNRRIIGLTETRWPVARNIKNLFLL